MRQYLSLLLLPTLLSCTRHSLLENNVEIQLYTYDNAGKVEASAMPKLRDESDLSPFKGRFEYLLINIPAIHSPGKVERRKEIFKLYPDTLELKKQYLLEFTQDKELQKYFDLTTTAVTTKNFEPTVHYNVSDLMEVASKFFYCDEVFPDTSVQSHVCIGLNGVDEANWKNDYRLLEAFCYEGIFNDLNKEVSRLDESYAAKKKEARLKYKPSITSLPQYLLDVRQELFKSMKEDPVLKTILLEYYEKNKNNLAFRISS